MRTLLRMGYTNRNIAQIPPAHLARPRAQDDPGWHIKCRCGTGVSNALVRGGFLYSIILHPMLTHAPSSTGFICLHQAPPFPISFASEHWRACLSVKWGFPWRTSHSPPCQTCMSYRTEPRLKVRRAWSTSEVMTPYYLLSPPTSMYGYRQWYFAHGLWEACRELWWWWK